MLIDHPLDLCSYHKRMFGSTLWVARGNFHVEFNNHWPMWMWDVAFTSPKKLFCVEPNNTLWYKLLLHCSGFEPCELPIVFCGDVLTKAPHQLHKKTQEGKKLEKHVVSYVSRVYCRGCSISSWLVPEYSFHMGFKGYQLVLVLNRLFFISFGYLLGGFHIFC